MGTINHNAIVVTGFSPRDNPTAFQNLRDSVAAVGLPTSAVVPAWLNGYHSFFVAPDGSKEYWDESDDGDDKRQVVRQILRESSAAHHWVEVSFGELGVKVEDSYRERPKL